MVKKKVPHEKEIEKENGSTSYQPEKMESRMIGGTQRKKMHTAKQIEGSRENGAGVTDQSSYTKDPGNSKGSNKSSYTRNQEYYSERDAISKTNQSSVTEMSSKTNQSSVTIETIKDMKRIEGADQSSPPKDPGTYQSRVINTNSKANQSSDTIGNFKSRNSCRG